MSMTNPDEYDTNYSAIVKAALRVVELRPHTPDIDDGTFAAANDFLTAEFKAWKNDAYATPPEEPHGMVDEGA